jgi:ferredoxin
MFWFLRGLRRGVVTTRYPAAIDPWTSTLPSAPAFQSRRLTAELTDRLEAACPTGALRREDGELVVDLGACTGCGRCADVAPGVVRPSGEFLIATRDRQALLKRIPIEGDGEHG